jgi:hypothetical protein
MSLLKIAETVEMSIDIPDSEKKVGVRIVKRLEKIINSVNNFNDHLDILYNPFKKYNTVSEESIHKYRGSLWDYKQQIEVNLDNIKDMVVKTISDLKTFSTDTSINELISTFTDQFGEIESTTITLIEDIYDLESESYKENIVSDIDSVKKNIEEFKRLIDDRLADHININILSKSWLEDIDEHMKENINEKEPIVTRLYKERNEKLNKIM